MMCSRFTVAGGGPAGWEILSQYSFIVCLHHLYEREWPVSTGFSLAGPLDAVSAVPLSSSTRDRGRCPARGPSQRSTPEDRRRTCRLHLLWFERLARERLLYAPACRSRPP